MDKQITLTIDGTTIHFNNDSMAHEHLIDEMQPNSKVGPTQKFLLRTVKEEDKAALKRFLDSPMNVMAIGGKVIEAMTPALKITVGE